jgi:TolA-binding protein
MTLDTDNMSHHSDHSTLMDHQKMPSHTVTASPSVDTQQLEQCISQLTTQIKHLTAAVEHLTQVTSEQKLQIERLTQMTTKSQPIREIRAQPPPQYPSPECESVDDWLYAMKNYLQEYADTPLGIDIAVTYLRGTAASRWRLLATELSTKRRGKPTNWKEFTNLIYRHVQTDNR